MIVKPVDDWATDFDHFSPEWIRDPHSLWHGLRGNCPVAHTERYGGVYLPTRYKDIVDAAYNHESFTSRTIIVRSVPLLQPFPAPPMNATGDQHRLSRKALLPGFTKLKTETYKAAVEARAVELSQQATANETFDVADRYARTLSVRSLMLIIGAPEADSPLLGAWTADVLIFGVRDATAVAEAADEMSRYCRELLIRKASSPGNDIASLLMKDWNGQHDNALDEAAATVRLLLLAGVDTTASVLSGALWHLGSNESDRRQLASDPDRMQGAVEEFLRVFAPTTMAREVHSDTTLAGTVLKAGQLLMLPFPAANRDPDVFPNPDRVDLERTPNKHLAFGIGIHRCLGDHFARAVISTGLRVWLKRFPDFTLDDEPRMEWSAGTIRGLTRLYVQTGIQSEEATQAISPVSTTTSSRIDVGSAVRKISSQGAAQFASARSFQAKGLLEDAWRCLRAALQTDPHHVEVLLATGALALKRGQSPVARAHFQLAARLAPTDFRPVHNLATIALENSQLDEALGHAQAAADIAPNVPEAHLALGSVMLALGRFAEGLKHVERASALQPDNSELLLQFMLLKRQVCDWRDFEEDERRVRGLAAQGHRVPPFALLSTRATNAEQHACARQWAKRLTRPSCERFATRPARRSGPLRIGYLSGDFHDHATSRLVAELFESHDRERFRIFGYSYGPEKPSALRDRMVQAFDTFRDLRNTSSANAARRIYDDEIDVLVDMKGYTSRARTEILSWRPAPIQVNYLGFPGTMGTDLVDYVITDRTISPPEYEAHSTERFAYLPHCFQPNDTLRAFPDTSVTRAQRGIPEDIFIYCCLNAAYKFTPQFFACWMRILKAVPKSILCLLVRSQTQADHLVEEARRHQIGPGRLVFVGQAKPEEHLARCALADLFLDTLPVSAFTTASDALWAGLPVLTCAGDTPAGRGSASLLTAIGTPELVTDTLEDYEKAAIELAHNPERLLRLRRHIEANRHGRAPFDTPRLARDLELLYERMIEGAI